MGLCGLSPGTVIPRTNAGVTRITGRSQSQLNNSMRRRDTDLARDTRDTHKPVLELCPSSRSVVEAWFGLLPVLRKLRLAPAEMQAHSGQIRCCRLQVA